MFGVGSLKAFKRLSCATLNNMGMKHLAAAYRSTGGNMWLAALRHNGGIGAGPRNRKAALYANAVMGKHIKRKKCKSRKGCK
jgi:hypothetical protein